MSKFTFDDVKDHLATIRQDLTHTLEKIDRRLRAERDSTNEELRVPIYLTKWRIKSASSAYLKTKIKGHNYDSLEDITDFGGLRILCLFEQDILKVHQFLVDSLLSNDSQMGLALREFSTFNWDDSSKRKLEEVVQKAGLRNAIQSKMSKDSGYRSVHYIIEVPISASRVLTIEIQLRTLLQDAWGELEHKLSYKQGSIHPHIKKSFVLLSQDLATADQLIAHLNDISQKETYTEIAKSKSTGPFSVFTYTDDVMPTTFKKKQNLGKLFEQYEAITQSIKVDRSWADQAKSKLSEIEGGIAVRDTQEDKNSKYWLDMEKAFLHFHGGEHEAARDLYCEIITNTKNEYPPCTYVTYFRYGEILFKLGNITQALTAFDKAEKMCEESAISGTSASSRHAEHIYRIKTKLAHIYWQLGDEYSKISLEEAREAEKLFHVFNELPPDKRFAEELALRNNLCWYYLMGYLNVGGKDVSESEHLFNEAKSHYEFLADKINTWDTGKPEVNSHTYDTCGWFCFQAYLRYKNKSDSQDEALAWLEKAKKFCELLLTRELPTRSTATFLSFNVQKAHFETIMCEQF